MKLVHLVGFITKKIDGHMNVKFRKNGLLPLLFNFSSSSSSNNNNNNNNNNSYSKVYRGSSWHFTQSKHS